MGFFKEELELERRTVTLMRMYNLRCSLSTELDAPSPRYGSIPKDGPGIGLHVSFTPMI